MGITFDPANLYINITSPTVSTTALDLYNASMDWADQLENSGYTVPMDANGKFAMGGGVNSDSIFRLINGWKISPWVAEAMIKVTGTILTDDETDRWIYPGGNVGMEFQVSSQATVVETGISGVTESDLNDMADKVWDELLTGASHNIPTSAGRRLRGLAGTVIHEDTAQANGGGNNQIILAATASSIDGAYDPAMLSIVGGTGAGQTRLILEYTGSTRTAIVDRGWKVAPDDTSQYVIYAHPGREHVNEGLAQGGTLNTIILNPLASDNDDAYVGQTVFIRSGYGEDQVNIVNSYNGTSKTATMRHNWDQIPTTTSGYTMLPTHVHSLPEVAEAVLDEPLTDHQIAGSVGEAIKGIYQVSVGRWKFDNTFKTMTIYDSDDSTPLVVFDMKDINGSPTLTNIYERVRQ